MNITFINDSLGFGGAEKVLVVIARGLKELGHNVSIINLNIRGEQIAQELQGINVETPSFCYCSSFKSNIKYILFTISKVRDLKSEVVVGFKFSSFYASIAGKVLNIPSIITERADPFITYRNAGFGTRLKLFAINHADGAVFQTEDAGKFYYKSLQNKSVVIPNPILVSQPIPAVSYNERSKTVVSLGRFDNNQKRLDVMVDAFSKFHKKHADYKLFIYGSGQDEGLIKEYIIKAGLQESAFIMGVSRNSLLDLSKYGIFIITSDFEGISNALLEAMAIGLPVVSTDHSPGGARLLISDHINGLLTPKGDSEALANALAEFADNPLLAEHCGREATKVLRRFALSEIVSQWEKYLSSIVINKSTRYDIRKNLPTI